MFEVGTLTQSHIEEGRPCGGIAGSGRSGSSRRNSASAGFVAAFDGSIESARGGGEFCYEAGPCGYGAYREITEAGHDCAVVAPSWYRRRAGDSSAGLGGAKAAVCPLPASQLRRQGQGQSHRRGGARAGGIHLGDRLRGQVGGVVSRGPWAGVGLRGGADRTARVAVAPVASVGRVGFGARPRRHAPFILRPRDRRSPLRWPGSRSRFP